MTCIEKMKNLNELCVFLSSLEEAPPSLRLEKAINALKLESELNECGCGFTFLEVYIDQSYRNTPIHDEIVNNYFDYKENEPYLTAIKDVIENIDTIKSKLHITK